MPVRATRPLLDANRAIGDLSDILLGVHAPVNLFGGRFFWDGWTRGASKDRIDDGRGGCPPAAALGARGVAQRCAMLRNVKRAALRNHAQLPSKARSDLSHSHCPLWSGQIQLKFVRRVSIADNLKATCSREIG